MGQKYEEKKRYFTRYFLTIDWMSKGQASSHTSFGTRIGIH